MVGILNCYHFDTTPGSYQETYEPMALDYFKKIMPGSEFKVYKVAQSQFPKDVNECSSWVLTGSPASAYEQKDWVLQLIEFINKAHSQKVKLLGICFGHQIIAQALGGKTENSTKGWGIGVCSFDITHFKNWMNPRFGNSCSLLYSHQDQVTQLPKEAIILGSNDFCPIQMYSLGEHIFSMQGHPEFTKEYAQSRYDSRQDKLGEQVYKEGIQSLSKPTDEFKVGEWIMAFLKE